MSENNPFVKTGVMPKENNRFNPEEKQQVFLKFPDSPVTGKSTVYIVFQTPLEGHVESVIEHNFFGLTGKKKTVNFPCLHEAMGEYCPGCDILASELEEAMEKNAATGSKEKAKSKSGAEKKQNFYVNVLEFEGMEKGKLIGEPKPRVWSIKRSLLPKFAITEDMFGTLMGRGFAVTRTGKGLGTEYSYDSLGESGVDLSKYEKIELVEAMPILKQYEEPKKMQEIVYNDLKEQFGEILDKTGHYKFEEVTE